MHPSVRLRGLSCYILGIEHFYFLKIQARSRPLIIASGGGHTRIVELLLTYTANVDMQDTVSLLPPFHSTLCL